jgi:hypothetical protein
MKSPIDQHYVDVGFDITHKVVQISVHNRIVFGGVNSKSGSGVCHNGDGGCPKCGEQNCNEAF